MLSQQDIQQRMLEGRRGFKKQVPHSLLSDLFMCVHMRFCLFMCVCACVHVWVCMHVCVCMCILCLCMSINGYMNVCMPVEDRGQGWAETDSGHCSHISGLDIRGEPISQATGNKWIQSGTSMGLECHQSSAGQLWSLRPIDSGN